MDLLVDMWAVAKVGKWDSDMENMWDNQWADQLGSLACQLDLSWKVPKMVFWKGTMVLRRVVVMETKRGRCVEVERKVVELDEDVEQQYIPLHGDMK